MHRGLILGANHKICKFEPIYIYQEELEWGEDQETVYDLAEGGFISMITLPRILMCSATVATTALLCLDMTSCFIN